MTAQHGSLFKTDSTIILSNRVIRVGKSLISSSSFDLFLASRQPYAVTQHSAINIFPFIANDRLYERANVVVVVVTIVVYGVPEWWLTNYCCLRLENNRCYIKFSMRKYIILTYTTPSVALSHIEIKLFIFIYI